MTNAPVVLSNNYPTLPPEYMQAAVAMFDKAFSGLGGVLRMITVDRLNFVLKDGAASTAVDFQSLVVVFVGGAEYNHAVWWEKDFGSDNNPPTAPDLVWKMPTMDTFPDAFPHELRHKIHKNGRDVWAFQIRRRLAFIIAKKTPEGGLYLDYEHPYAMDISSASMFGQSFPQSNAYKWGAIKDLCSSMSAPGRPILPFMFPLQVVPNPQITGPVLFKPARDQQGNLNLLDNDTLLKVMQVVTSETVRTMLDVTEKLTYGDAQPVATPAKAQAAPAQPAAPVQPVQRPEPAPVAAPAAPVATPQPAAPVAQTNPGGINAMLNEAAGILNGSGAASATAADILNSVGAAPTATMAAASQPQAAPQQPAAPQPQPTAAQPSAAGDPFDAIGAMLNALGSD